MKKPLGKRSPWVWSVELVRGCNLSCWHCTARFSPEEGTPRFMSRETWVAMCDVIAKTTPGIRLEVAQGGEPTLHPELYDFLRLARCITPTTQLQVTTNGLTMLAGKVSFKDLFDAGANVVYVDMYGDRERYIEMAKATGAEWYKYDKVQSLGSPGHKMANTYYPDRTMRLIVLQDNPEYRMRWRKNGRLSTFLNHLDWNASMPYGLVPVRTAYKRKCTMPLRYVSLSYEGDYLFCCIDFMCESAGLMGNVKDGAEHFSRFWFGRMMQSIRARLYEGNRGEIPYCSRCNCAFAKCDWVNIWPQGSLDNYWDGHAWVPLPGNADDIFADGWKRARAIVLPSKEEEDAIVAASKKQRKVISRDMTQGSEDAPDCPLVE